MMTMTKKKSTTIVTVSLMMTDIILICIEC